MNKQHKTNETLTSEKSMLSYFMDCVNVTGRLLGHQLTSSAVIIITLDIPNWKMAIILNISMMLIVDTVNYQEREALQESTRKVKIFFDDKNAPCFPNWENIDNFFKKYLLRVKFKQIPEMNFEKIITIIIDRALKRL